MQPEKSGNSTNPENTSLQVNSSELNSMLTRLEAGLEAQKADRAELESLKARLATQENEINSLRHQLATKAQVTLGELVQTQPTSRRTLLRRVGGAAAGLAAFSLAAGLTEATALAGDPSIQADGDSSSYGAQFSGGLAPVRLAPASAAGGRTTGTHAAGELYVETDGSLWYTPDGTNWQKFGSSFNFLSTPVRVLGAPATAEPGIPANTGTPSSPAYFQVGGGSIPNTATAILATIVVYGSNNAGYIGLYPADAGLPLAPIASMAYGGNQAFTSATVSVKLGNVPGTSNKGFAALAFTGVKFSFDVSAYTI